MNIGGFHAVGNAWLALLIAPLVMFYFLKLKRPRREISSLALWRQVMQDQRVNAPFQRFKRNLLLLLQLMILVLLVLAALQPFLRTGPASRPRAPVLLDCSASMAALDRPGGTTRLADAKRRVLETIDGLAPNQELCIVSFAGSARKRCGFTSNKRLLREALDTVAVEPQTADLEEALRLAQGLARSDPFDQVLLYSDGNVPSRVNVDLSFRLNYQRVPAGGPNQGITALAAQRAPDGGWNLFVQVEGSDDGAGSATVDVTREGSLFGSERLTLLRGRAQRLLFRVPGEKPSVVHVRLAPDNFDSLSLDNAAEIALPEERPLRVFVSPDLGGYRRALSGVAGIRMAPADASAEGVFDLVIADRAQDAALSAGVRFTVGMVPEDLQRVVSVGSDGTQVVDWRRDCDVLRHVELGDLTILDRPVYAQGAGEGDLENAGYEALAHGRGGPLLVRKNTANAMNVAMLFHSDRSTLPYRVGFPILVANLVQAGLDRAGLAEVRGTRSLYSVAETSLVSAENIEFNERLAVAAASAPVRSDWALWPWLLVAALAVLLAEWWFFHRRSAT
jgi:Ca-activated chloride channel family protein